MKEKEMAIIADLIHRTFQSKNDILALEQIAHEVNQLCNQFPLYPDLEVLE